MKLLRIFLLIVFIVISILSFMILNMTTPEGVGGFALITFFCYIGIRKYVFGDKILWNDNEITLENKK